MMSLTPKIHFDFLNLWWAPELWSGVLLKGRCIKGKQILSVKTPTFLYPSVKRNQQPNVKKITLYMSMWIRGFLRLHPANIKSNVLSPTHTHTHTYIYIYIYLHIYTHTHTRKPEWHTEINMNTMCSVFTPSTHTHTHSLSLPWQKLAEVHCYMQ